MFQRKSRGQYKVLCMTKSILRRQLDRYRRSFSGCALNLDVTSHSSREVARDRESQSYTCILPRPASVDLKKRLEHAVNFFRLATGARVGNAYRHPVTGSPRCKLYAAERRSKLYRVAEPVEQNLTQLYRVGAYHQRRVTAVPDVGQLVPYKIGTQQRLERIELLANTNRFRRYRDCSRLDFREAQHIVDQSEQVFFIATNTGNRVMLPRGKRTRHAE